jgi:autotransporter translocation and assembly factor TamB
VGETPLVARAPVRLRLVDERLRFESLYSPRPGGRQLVVAGSLGLAPDAPLDLRLHGVVENAWLAPVLPGFRLTGTSDVLATVRGTLEAPRVNGQASLRPGVQLTSEALADPITDVRAVALFYPDRLVIDNFVGDMGGGTLQASGTLRVAALRRAAVGTLPDRRPRRHAPLPRGLAGAG